MRNYGKRGLVFLNREVNQRTVQEKKTIIIIIIIIIIGKYR